MTDDPRCCSTGTCIIDPQGRCWCGQQWDGTQMCAPPRLTGAGSEREASIPHATPHATHRTNPPAGGKP